MNDKDTYGYLFKVLLVRLLVDPGVNDFEILVRQHLGLLAREIAKLFVVGQLAHAACSPLPPL